MHLNVKFLQVLFIIYISFESINSGNSNKIIIIFLILKMNFLISKHSYHFQQFFAMSKVRTISRQFFAPQQQLFWLSGNILCYNIQITGSNPVQSKTFPFLIKIKESFIPIYSIKFNMIIRYKLLQLGRRLRSANFEYMFPNILLFNIL